MKDTKIIIDADILLIENNPQQASKMLKMIEKHQITNSTFWLEDGNQAMDYLHGEGVFADRDTKITPRLIFLNNNIPTKNGLEVLSEIRSTPSLKHIPVVFMCSEEQEQDQIKYYDPNVNNSILKPFNAGELTYIMNNHKELNTKEAEFAQSMNS